MPHHLLSAQRPEPPGDDAPFDPAGFDTALLGLRLRPATGGYHAIAEALEALLAGCPLSESRRRAQALALLAQIYPRIGQLQGGARCAAEAVGLASRQGDDALLADALSAQSFLYSQLLMGREALEGALRSLSLARRLNDGVREAWAMNRIGIAQAALDNPAQGCDAIAEALEIASKAEAKGTTDMLAAALDARSLREVRFSCLNNLAYFWLRRLEEAAALGDEHQLALGRVQVRRTAEQAVTVARRSGDPYQVAVAISNLVDALLAVGELDAALPALNEFGNLAHDNGYANLATEAETQRAIYLRLKGQPEQAVRMLNALLHAHREPTPKLRRLLQQALYEAHKACAEHREALTQLESLVRLERQIRRDTQVLQTEIIMIREQVEQAQARADSARADAERERARAAHLEQEQQRLREHAQALDRAAHEDVLTGLHNRRHAEFALPLLVEGARVAGEVISLAMLDLDHFKQINDTYGHAVGDAVLQQLAQLLRHRLRSADLLARIGGEEFVAVLVGISPQQAGEICERLRLAVAEHDWGRLAAGMRVHISVGIAGGPPPQQANDLLDRADKALYTAKRGGRNQVHVD
jgi:diguanylate cyclase (GGDEF)-like protein